MEEARLLSGQLCLGQPREPRGSLRAVSSNWMGAALGVLPHNPLGRTKKAGLLRKLSASFDAHFITGIVYHARHNIY